MISIRKDIGKRYRCCGVLWASHKKRIWEFFIGKGMGKRHGFCGGGGFSWWKDSGVFRKVGIGKQDRVLLVRTGDILYNDSIDKRFVYERKNPIEKHLQ